MPSESLRSASVSVLALALEGLSYLDPYSVQPTSPNYFTLSVEMSSFQSLNDYAEPPNAFASMAWHINRELQESFGVHTASPRIAERTRSPTWAKGPIRMRSDLPWAAR
jgi:hypothetical protein